MNGLTEGHIWGCSDNILGLATNFMSKLSITMSKRLSASKIMLEDDNRLEKKQVPVVMIYLPVFAVMATYLSIAASLFQAIQPTIEIDNGEEIVNTTTSFLDAFYFSTVTLTTVGFGDITPDSTVARSFVCAFISVSLIVVGFVMDVIDTVLTANEKEQQLMNIDGQATKKFLGMVEMSLTKAKFFHRVILVVFMMLVGVLFFTTVEGFTVTDAFYFSIVTLTTVGFGDLHPQSREGKIFGIFWIGFGCLFTFQMLSAFMDFLMDKRRKLIRKQLQSRTKLIQEETAEINRHISIEAPQKLDRQRESSALNDYEEAVVEHSMATVRAELQLLVDAGKITREEASHVVGTWIPARTSKKITVNVTN